MKDIRLVVLSGPSGAGKSTAIHVLEDLGFFCVDNMPVTLLPKFLELIDSTAEINRAAVVVDVRERSFLKEFPSIFTSLKEAGYTSELIYLEASDEALVKRFSETRRRHPLAHGESPLEGIELERKLLGEVKAFADNVVDTTNYNVHNLKQFLKNYFAAHLRSEHMTVNLVSFGYRYGIPADGDIVIDVRFLSNPFFIDELKSLDGRDDKVKEYVLSRKESTDFLKRFEGLISYLLPLYWKEGKSYLTIAVGCTGGRHRSVAIAEHLAGELESGMAAFRVRHRDINRA